MFPSGNKIWGTEMLRLTSRGYTHTDVIAFNLRDIVILADSCWSTTRSLGCRRKPSYDRVILSILCGTPEKVVI